MSAYIGTKAARKWTGQIGSGGVADASVATIPIQSATGLTNGAVYVFTVDRVDSNGVKTASKEEVIKGTLSGTNFVSCTRGVAGTAQAHSAGAVVEVLMEAVIWNELVEGLEVEHDTDGTHKAITAPSITLASGATVNEFSTDGTLAGNSDTAVPTEKAVKTAIDAITSGTATRSLWIPPASWGVGGAGSAVRSVDTTDITIAWLLDAAADELVQSEFFVLPSTPTGNLTIKSYWAMVSATTGNVVIRMRYRIVPSNDTLTGINTLGNVTESVPASSDYLKITSHSTAVSGYTAGSLIKLEFGRIGTDGSDTATGDLQFLGALIEYTAD